MRSDNDSGAPDELHMAMRKAVRFTDSKALLVGAALTLGVFTLYAFTLAPSVMPGDYAEFQMCAAILGVPHPTGYPLYILLGKLFTLLPFGDVAYRVNLSSAVYMAGAVGMVYALGLYILQLTRARHAKANSLIRDTQSFVSRSTASWHLVLTPAIGASLFALAPTVWSMSLVARSYALNALLVSSVLYALLRWRNSGGVGWFYGGVFGIGLSMVHHGTTYLLLPAYGIYLLIIEIERHRGRQDARPWLRRVFGVGALLFGYTPMLFLVYRFVWGAPFYWGNPTTWSEFLSLITGGPFHNQVLAFGWDMQGERFVFGLGELLGQYTIVGIALGLTGLLVLWRTRQVEAALLSLMIVGNFSFAMNYSLVGYLYFIPTFLMWAVLISVGSGWFISAAGKLLESRVNRAGKRALATFSALMLIATFTLLLLTRYSGIDQSGQTATRDEALALLENAPQGASIYLDWEDVSVVRYFRMVYGMRQDTALHTGDPADWPKGIYCDLANGTAVIVGEFSGERPPEVARRFQLEPAPMGWHATRVANAEALAIPPCGLCATCR